jgi:hypothetical protein
MDSEKKVASDCFFLISTSATCLLEKNMMKNISAELKCSMQTVSVMQHNSGTTVDKVEGRLESDTFGQR